MRGADTFTESLFTIRRLDDFVPDKHPLRAKPGNIPQPTDLSSSTPLAMGVKLNHALTPRTNLTASFGLEQDLHHKTDQLIATGVAGLTSENFNNNIKRTRPVASAGVYYAVTKTQRLSGEVYYQQLPFQSTDSATAYVNYIIGF